MPFDFAIAKETARRAVHETFAVQAFYSDDSINEMECRVRWHNRKTISNGELNNGDGYAAIIEGIDRIIFQRLDTSIPSVIQDVLEYEFPIKRNGVVRFPSLQDAEFVLDYMLPMDGPLDEVWSVTRK